MSAKKHHNSEAIIRKLRQAEILIHEGQSISEICRTLGISDATYYKWRKEYGGMQMDQARRLKELEKEKKITAILKDATIFFCQDQQK